MHLHAYSLRIFHKLLILVVLTVAGPNVYSQYYSTGQEAASIKWKQISTEHVKILFPDYYESQARKLAGYLDTVYGFAGNSLNYHPKRISLVMHTQSSVSNAVVAWAPKRMEFYTTPSQNMYAQPWLEQLSLHEFRHVVQIEKLNQGPTKVLSWLFGQQGTGVVLGLYLPPWCMEGDAVATETGLSYSGRGRLPLFEMNNRALFLEKGIYSYDKATLGSYKDFVPDRYEIGYLLVAEGRRKYGPELWEHTLNRVARRPYMITPFQKGIKDISGKRKIPFYKDCMDGLKQRWQVQDGFTNSHLMTPVSPVTEEYTDYRHPAFINDSKVFALRTSLDDIARFVSIDADGKEEVIFTPGFLKTETISFSAGKICWAESRPDLRWSNRSYTTIRIYDTGSGKARTLYNRMRLFAPALNHDGSKLVAVHVDSLDRYALVIMDALSGEIEMRMPTPSNVFPMTPVWAGDDLIITILVSEDGKNLAKFDVSSGRFKTFLRWDFTDISQPVYHYPYIFYTAAWSGISNIYALNIREESIHKISYSRFGAVDAVISDDGKSLMYADYSSDGYRIVQLPLEPADWILLDDIEDRSIGLYEAIVAQEEVVPAWSEIPASDAPAKKYSKIGNLFNFHSWAPLAINASTYDINPGISIMSQNLLSSSFLTAGYSYNINEQAGKVYGAYSYHGWYPVFDLHADYGLRRELIYLPEETEISWNETNLRAGLRVPLNLRRGKYFAGIQPSVYVNQGLRRLKPGSPVEFKKADIFSAGYSLTAYRQIKSSFRDIYPRWGQSLGLYYRDTPFDHDNFSYIVAGIASLYFPGIIRHHGLNIYAGYQYRITGYYKFSDIVSYPRGISGRQDQELVSFRGTYAFPIAYPDWSIGPVIYMKRIRANLFYDYAVGLNTTGKNYYNSTGVDVLTEVHVLRFIAPLDIGVRCVYLPDEGSLRWSFLFGIGFSSFYVNKGPAGESVAF